MIKMELEENLKSINQAEVAYLNEYLVFTTDCYSISCM